DNYIAPTWLDHGHVAIHGHVDLGRARENVLPPAHPGDRVLREEFKLAIGQIPPGDYLGPPRGELLAPAGDVHLAKAATVAGAIDMSLATIGFDRNHHVIVAQQLACIGRISPRPTYLPRKRVDTRQSPLVLVDEAVARQRT